MRYLLPVLFVCISGALLTTESNAQSESPWTAVCVNPSKPNTCRMVQTLNANRIVDNKQQNLGRILDLTVVYAVNEVSKKRVPYLSIQMPLGVDLRSGTVIRVGDNKEIKLPFLRCTTRGCDASLQLDPKFLRSLLASSTLHVGFRGWGHKKITVIAASLAGFTTTFSKIK